MATKPCVGVVCLPKVTIRDIAKRAGVSPATVSNVLNRKNRVSDATRESIFAVAAEMGYKAGATALRASIRLVIYKKHGLVVMDTPFFSELVSGVEKTCRAHGYALTISYVSGFSDDRMRQIDEILADASQAILLLATEMDEEDFTPFAHARVPLLVLDSSFFDQPFDSVCIHNFDAGCLAARCFLENGHTEFGILTSSKPFYNAQERCLGFQTYLNRHGYQVSEENILPVEPTMEGAYRDMGDLIAARETRLPGALFSINDIIAVGAARALKVAGYRLPQDISLIGMDDLPICQILNPPLTTIAVSKTGLAVAAVNRLIGMTGDDNVQSIRIGVRLVARESVLRVQKDK